MKTIAYDETKWKLVPLKLTTEMEISINMGMDDSCSTQAIWDAAIENAPTPPADGQLQLICPTCGADRFKVDCQGNRMNCGIKGEAQSADGQAQLDADKGDAQLKTHPLEAYAESYELMCRIAIREGREPVVSPSTVACDIRQNMIPATVAAQPDPAMAGDEINKAAMAVYGTTATDKMIKFAHNLFALKRVQPASGEEKL